MNSVLNRGFNAAYSVPACLLEKRLPWASPKLLGALQRRRLRSIVKHAWNHVPFYRGAMEKIGMTPADIRRGEDLQRLPLISNQDIRRDPSLFNSDTADFENDLLLLAGNYKKIYWSRKAALQWFTRITRFRTVINNLLEKDSGYVEVYINPVKSCNAVLNEFWKENLLFRGRAAGRFRLDINDPYEETVEKINAIRPDIIYCFGSHSEHLLKFIHHHNLPFYAPEIWVYGSDMMNYVTRKFIEERFGCLVYSAYNMNEMGAMAFECENRDGYHLNTDACFVRIADEDGETVPEGETGEVIISNLVNTSTVILNYRTGDRGRLSREQCPCGRTLPLLKELLGRISDTVYCADGISMSFGLLDSQVSGILDEVASFQIVQDRPGHISWHLVPLPGCDQEDVRMELLQLMSKIIKPSNQVEIKWIDKVEVTSGQKRRSVIHRFET